MLSLKTIRYLVTNNDDNSSNTIAQMRTYNFNSKKF